jgi:hypothetical protein
MDSVTDEVSIDKGLNTETECSTEKAFRKENSKIERSETKNEKDGLSAALSFIQYAKQNNDKFSEEIISGTDKHDYDEELEYEHGMAVSCEVGGKTFSKRHRNLHYLNGGV